VAERELRRTIEIDAAPGAVWSVLTDTAAFPSWNPFIRRLEGELREGGKLVVRIQPPGGRAMTFKPTVLSAVPAREVRWLGRLFVPGLFDGEHTFLLEDYGDGRTLFTQSERFTGLLVGAFGGTLAKTEEGFEQMNEALKRRVEDATHAGEKPEV
jgi:hypothetical protein